VRLRNSEVEKKTRLRNNRLLHPSVSSCLLRPSKRSLPPSCPCPMPAGKADPAQVFQFFQFSFDQNHCVLTAFPAYLIVFHLKPLCFNSISRCFYVFVFLTKSYTIPLHILKTTFKKLEKLCPRRFSSFFNCFSIKTNVF
jgi:hypothetical protein